jgi:4-amino-4-deoxy-L-arabinose transferase-like glycosyltransferase
MWFEQTWLTRRHCVWGLFIIGLAGRLFYIFQGHPVPLQDTPDYDEIALNILAGEGFVSRTNWHGFEMRSWRAPFYPIFLALVYHVFFYSYLAVQICQALVGAATGVLVYRLGYVLHRPSAIWAGLVVAFYGPFWGSANEVMTETWFTFWLVLTVWFMVVADKRWHYLMGAGLALGLAALTRPVGLVLWAAYCLYALKSGVKIPGAWNTPGILRSLLKDQCGAVYCIALVSAGVALVVLPWTWRNYQVHDALVPISTHGGFIIARSNAAQPDWRIEQGWGIKAEVFERMPTEVERDRHWRRQGVAFIRHNPGPYLILVGQRFLRFWYFFRPDYNFWYMLVLPFFIAGLYRFKQQDAFLLLSLFIGLSVLCFSFVLYGSTRFRLPLEPFFILFAAAYAHDFAGRQGRGRTAALLASVLVLNLVAEFSAESARALLMEWLQRWNLT